MVYDLLSLLLSGGDPPARQDRLDALRDRLSPEPTRLVRSGEPVRAIRAVREETGATLREAVALVKCLEETPSAA